MVIGRTNSSIRNGIELSIGRGCGCEMEGIGCGNQTNGWVGEQWVFISFVLLEYIGRGKG